jgi:hypothetical protein
MENTIRMFIETTNGEKLEQDVPQGLVEIYHEKGWKEVPKEVEEPTKKEVEEPFFTSKKSKIKSIK